MAGKSGAVAAMMTLLMGMRCSEIPERSRKRNNVERSPCSALPGRT
jgi:hypothetical protein